MKAIAKPDSTMLKRVRDYISRNSPEPEILRVIGEESARNGTDKLSSDDIDEIIRAARADRKKRSDTSMTTRKKAT